MAVRRLILAWLLFQQTVSVASAQDGVTVTPPPRLAVDVVFYGPPLPPRLEASAMEEITVIWAAYGVDVRAAGASDSGRSGAVRLGVRFAGRPGQRVAAGALGSILFVDDVPEPSIVMYTSAIDALVATVTIHESHDHEWPTAFRDLIVGRVLGRALAHEIGHFLLRSRLHSAAGLMRMAHSAADLIATDRHRFMLSLAELTRLESVASTCFESSPEPAAPAGSHSR